MQRSTNQNSSSVCQTITKLMDINIESKKSTSSLNKILSLPTQNQSLAYDKLAESLQKNHALDYTNVIEIMKILKSIDLNQQKKLESILTSKADGISNSAITEIMENLKTDNNNSMHDLSNHSKNNIHTGGRKSSEIRMMDDLIIEEMLSGDDSETDTLSIKSLIPRKDGTNLIDNVKENLDHLLQANLIKRKNTKKKWWTREEVNLFSAPK